MKGCLLRFELNSTATSHGGAQKLGNDVWHDFKSIASKVCIQISRKRNAIFGRHVDWVTSVDRSSFDFRYEDFVSNLPLKTIICCVTDRLSITRSRRSVLNFKFSVLIFSRSMICSMSNEQKLCKVKIFQLQSMSNVIRCIDQRFAFKNCGVSCLPLSGLDIQPEQSENDNSARKKEVPGCEVRRLIYRFFREIDHQIRTHASLMAKWIGEFQRVGWLGFDYRRVFAWHWARQCTDMSAFILLHSL